mgnify:CR=1 FL=1
MADRRTKKTAKQIFGYETSEKDPQITMREQALSIGGAYLSLEDFEKTQQDAIITGEAAAYENQGVTIDEIRVSSKFDEEDLCWYIAINSVAHKQDLSEMKPEEVQSLLISNLKHTTRLESSGAQTVLRIIFQPLDKDKLMDDLEFDEDAKTWAGALFETIYESDALNKYKDKFEAYKPSYAGDTGYTGPAEASPGGSGGGGGAESGGSADNTIDISGFTNPRTKNNHDLAAYAIQAWEHGWGYVWGTFGTVLTESMLQYKLEQYPDIGASEAFIREHWLGRRTTDCVGLLKGYGWLNPDTLTIDYNTARGGFRRTGIAGITRVAWLIGFKFVLIFVQNGLDPHDGIQDIRAGISLKGGKSVNIKNIVFGCLIGQISVLDSSQSHNFGGAHCLLLVDGIALFLGISLDFA